MRNWSRWANKKLMHCNKLGKVMRRYAGSPTGHTAFVKAAVSEDTTPTAAHCLLMLKDGCNSISRAAADFASAVCPSLASAAIRQT